MKSKCVKLTALLIIAVLVTLCFASSTVAYYHGSSANAVSSARVAYWGWGTPPSVTSSAIASSYTGVANTMANAVSSDSIIAPGTSGSVEFKVSGVPTTAPEVDYEYGWTVAITGQTASKLKYGLSADDVTKTAAELAAAVTKTQASAGTAPSGTDLTIYWAWEFGDAETADATSGADVIFTASFEASQIWVVSEEDPE